jgi:hypothetical protein
MSSHFTLASSVAILTKHDKQSLLSPLFERAFGLSLTHTDKFDTDSLGSFDNKVARTLTAKQAALKKAYLACDLTACVQGLGSEGSFNSVFPIGTVNEEIIAFVDIEHQIEVIARATKLTPLGIVSAASVDELTQKLSRYSTDQRWMLKQNDGYIKGLSLPDVIMHGNNQTTWPLALEADFRAMYCPDRQAVITLAGEDLITRLSSICPRCTYLDFVAEIPVKGRVCELCNQPTEQVKYFLAKCTKCAYEEKRDEVTTATSAFNCNFCNP